MIETSSAAFPRPRRDRIKSKIRSLKWNWIFTALVMFVMSAIAAQGQQPKTLPRIGLLVGGSAVSDGSRIEAFRQGLHELGYVEGKSIAFEYRYANGKPNRLNDLAATLLRVQVNIIVAGGPAATRAAKQATTTIPIVMAQVNDPVGDGFVATLARSAGNITGLSVMAPELSGKQLEILKETIPRLSRVAVLGTGNQPGTTQALNETELSARALAVELQFVDVRNRTDIEAAFRSLTKGHTNALFLLSGPMLFVERPVLIKLAAQAGFRRCTLRENLSKTAVL